MLCTFNNMTLRNARKDKAYQALMIDLVHLGIVDKEQAEGILGYSIPEGLGVTEAFTKKKTSVKKAKKEADEE